MMTNGADASWSITGGFATLGSSDPPSYESIAHQQSVFAPIETNFGQVARITAQPQAFSQGNNLSGKAEAAVGQRISSGQTGRSSCPKSAIVLNSPEPNLLSAKRKDGLAALARWLSKMISTKDEERIEEEREVPTHPASLLSHKLVGAASPFPMRPSLAEAIELARQTSAETLVDCPPSYPIQTRSS